MSTQIVMIWHDIPRNETICTQDAIEFPAQGYIRHLIKERKVLRQAKDMLRKVPDKYDVRKQQAQRT